MPIRKLSDIVNENFQRNLGQISAAPPDWLVSAYPELFAKDWEGKTYMTGGAYPGAFPTLDMSRLPEDQRARLSAEELAAGFWKDIGDGNVWAPDAADENDWLSPAGMIAGFGLSGALNGAFSGLGGVEGAALPTGMEYTAQMPGGMEGSSVSVADVADDALLAQGPGPWANTPPYPDYTSQLVNGTVDYGQLGAQLGEVGFATPGSVGAIPIPTGSFQNPDGTWGSTAANSAIGGAGVAAAQGASQGNTPWMDDPSALANLAASLGISPDILKMLGNAAPGLIGALASSKQTDAYKQLADKFASYGEPYRQRLSDIYKDPTAFLNSAEVQKPVQMASDIMARSLSTRGNPTGSGNAMQQLQSYSADQLFGRLGQEKDRLAGFGGLSNYNQAAPSAAASVIGSNTNTANAVGAAVNNIFSPPKTLAEQLQEFKTMSAVP